MRCYLLFALFIVFSFHSSAQIIPTEGDTLNYRLVGFSVPQNAKAASYMLEIAEGNFSDDKEFRKNIIVSDVSKNSKIIATVPAFGKTYTWRVNYLNKKNKKKAKTELYHFVTGIAGNIDTNKFRICVIDSAKNHDDLFILCDYNGTLYNLKGEPMWYLPNLFSATQRELVRDLKLSPQGTITAITNLGAQEFNYRGEPIWTAPKKGTISGDTSEHFHHEFTRLNKGTYMVLGDEELVKKIPSRIDSCLYIDNSNAIRKDDGFYVKARSGTVIEYDSMGNILWHWKSNDHFTDDDYFSDKRQGGPINTSTHLNGFFFDEEKGIIYLSYRDLDRIVKIKYPSGEIIRNYGKKNSNIRRQDRKKRENNASPLFSGQHCCRISRQGYLYLFNNNTGRERGKFTSYVSVFKEPENPLERLNKLWEFPCDLDTNTLSGAAAGGSVYMLPDGSILTSMGGAGRTFIVTPEKKVVWNSIFQYRETIDDKWQPASLYRASYIHKNNLYDLLFYKGKQ